MSFPSYVKDPDARLDYEIDWSEWLGSLPAVGDVITDSVWECDDPAIVLEDAQFDNTSATVFASGGVIGTTYLITNRIETGQGRINDQTIRLKIKAK